MVGQTCWKSAVSSWMEEEGAQRLILMVVKADNIWDACKDRGSSLKVSEGGSSQCLAPRQTVKDTALIKLNKTPDRVF